MIKPLERINLWTINRGTVCFNQRLGANNVEAPAVIYKYTSVYYCTAL